MDADTFLLPDAFTLPGILLGILSSAVCSAETLPGVLQALLGLAMISGFLLLIRMTYQLIRKREGMGFGDVKLGAMLGAWLGWRLGSVALFLAIAGGAFGGILLLLLNARRVHGEKQEIASLRIPFGTFLAVAGIITVFAGDPLLRWYLGLFR
jgi:leader peptidase (prepilin peptidase)/N-methyltransferase